MRKDCRFRTTSLQVLSRASVGSCAVVEFITARIDECVTAGVRQDDWKVLPRNFKQVDC